MKKIFLLLLVTSLSFAQQGQQKISRRIKLMESFLAENFEMPEKVLVYSGGNFELASNYRNLFSKIKKRTSKVKSGFDYVYNERADFPKNLKSFDELNIKFKNDEYNAICILLLGEVDMSNPDKTSSNNIQMYISKSPEYYYDFYMLMVEANTNNILLKNKYKVKSMDLFDKDGKELAKVISKVFIEE